MLLWLCTKDFIQKDCFWRSWSVFYNKKAASPTVVISGESEFLFHWHYIRSFRVSHHWLQTYCRGGIWHIKSFNLCISGRLVSFHLFVSGALIVWKYLACFLMTITTAFKTLGVDTNSADIKSSVLEGTLSEVTAFKVMTLETCYQ